jgi:hypothetical protein
VADEDLVVACLDELSSLQPYVHAPCAVFYLMLHEVGNAKDLEH